MTALARHWTGSLDPGYTLIIVPLAIALGFALLCMWPA